MRRGRILFGIFTFSGFSGLIYESIWTQYLKLFLGHAAYAQTLVLAIFMGGMAVGSWLCGRYSLRWKNLLTGYAVAEGIIGVSALLFHSLFVRSVEYSYGSVIPLLGLPLTVTLYKWILSTLLILPQSILLGMTFPLMTAGFLRLFPHRPGRSIALLYFANSMGAVAGVLVSGFFLTGMLGLPGTIRVAGLINITLAVIVWFLARRYQHHENAGGPVKVEKGGLAQGRYRLCLFAALLTGVASFLYEIGWIRMLSLVLGSSTHAFELMLSAFILGLAGGGLWIQKKIDHLVAPLTFLARLQVVMGLLALSSLLLYGQTFQVMQWLVATLPKSDYGYTLFNLASSALAMAVMVPTAFCAGTTLPLLTVILFREGAGERSIGGIYAANTVGAIMGVFFAVHAGMPLLGLKGVITLGASLDIALGLFLLVSATRQAGTSAERRLPLFGRDLNLCLVAGFGGIVATCAFVQLDDYKMGSGVYRDGLLLNPNGFRHLFHRDGTTATVDLFQDGMGSLRINTNGKTDATIMMDPARGAGMDESTMVLLAALPMAFHPQAKTVAAIGLGSGLTTHTLLLNPLLSQVDTVEIEPAMVDAARQFRPNVELVYTDPRSKIFLDDAKTFFSTRKKSYDIIISEPSNPWVSGVSGLFSREFYQLITRHLTRDGLFVQWVQLYEINTPLVISILKAVSANFTDFAIYAPNDMDIVILARKSGQLPAVDPRILKQPLLAALLARNSVAGSQDITLRKVGDRKALGRFIDSFPVPVNSDYYPLLDQSAPRSRFLNETAQELLTFALTPLPVAKLLSGSVPVENPTTVTSTAAFSPAERAFAAMAMRDYLLSGSFGPRYDRVDGDDKQLAIRLKEMFTRCGAVTDTNERFATLFMAATTVIPFLSPLEQERIWQSLESARCASSLSSRERMTLRLFRATAVRDGGRMAEAAVELLQQGTGFNGTMQKYLAAAAMTGYLLQGKTDEANRFWTRQGSLLFRNGEPDLLFRLLVAESSRR
jgi:spermidine synthase